MFNFSLITKINLRGRPTYTTAPFFLHFNNNFFLLDIYHDDFQYNIYYHLSKSPFITIVTEKIIELTNAIKIQNPDNFLNQFLIFCDGLGSKIKSFLQSQIKSKEICKKIKINKLKQSFKGDLSKKPEIMKVCIFFTRKMLTLAKLVEF